VASGAILATSEKLQETEDKNKEHLVLTYDPTLNLLFIKARRRGGNQEIYERSKLLTWKEKCLFLASQTLVSCVETGVNSEGNRALNFRS
jgi:hypothetical protein